MHKIPMVSRQRPLARGTTKEERAVFAKPFRYACILLEVLFVLAVYGNHLMAAT